MQAQKYSVFSITELKKAVLNKPKVQFVQQFLDGGFPKSHC